MPAARGPIQAAPFTKGQVNRAGQLGLDFRDRVLRDGAEPAEAEFDLDALDEAYNALTWWRTLHGRSLTTVAASLRYHVDKASGGIGARAGVTQRLKRLPTMIEKLGREPGNISQMQDIGGVRAVLIDLDTLQAVRRRLRKSWARAILRERDYIAEPKESGYRAVHIVVRRLGYPVEVQLRTVLQDAWANHVEERSRETGIGLKFGAGDDEERENLRIMADTLAAVDREDITPDRVRAYIQQRLRSSDE